jgi:PIN domain nuclease of toxin-antitoxin system
VKVLLDTHVLLWWLLGNPRLSAAASSILGDAQATILASAVSGHEIAAKFRLGKLAVPARLAENLDRIVAENGWQPLAPSIAHGQLAGRLTGAQRPVRSDACRASADRRRTFDHQRSCHEGIRGKVDLVARRVQQAKRTAPLLPSFAPPQAPTPHL